jgi:hypothetical protein
MGKTMKLLNRFFCMLCFLLCADILTVPQLFAIDQYTIISLQGNGPSTGKEAGPLQPPFIIAPEEISEVRDVFDIDIVWRSVPNAAGYHVIIARDRAFKNIIFDNAKITDTSHRIRNLDFGTHFLKISTISGDGKEGPFSDMRSFMIVPHPATAPQSK